MSLRNQPYIPLYVNDFMTDEKLCECSAESTGVYIRLMCLMHKSEEYGTILLQQKFKQNSSTCRNFACKLVAHLPYTVDVIERSLVELVENGVLALEGDKILQRRMVKDFMVSNVRSEAGQKGGFAKAKELANTLAKSQQNTVIEYVNENTDETRDKKEGTGRKIFVKPTLDEVTTYCLVRKNSITPQAFLDYYESNGWKVGRNGMSDWKAAVRTWEQRDNLPAQRKTQSPADRIMQIVKNHQEEAAHDI